MNDRQDNFLDRLEGVEKFPWTDKLFTVDSKSKKFECNCKAKIFHAFVMNVMKGMFFVSEDDRTFSQESCFWQPKVLSITEAIGKNLSRL